MQVQSLDHVNIHTADVAALADFYTSLLGLTRRNPPPPITPDQGMWLEDAAGRPIIHLFRDEAAQSGPTGAINHVALACIGKDEMIARLEAQGAKFRVSENSAAGFTQIFTYDPQGVLLELNFSGG
jgi:catechol 2,3-dioxygenase-like lactoylglutathione lyase family enzyme